jgi:hypothetical protein
MYFWGGGSGQLLADFRFSWEVLESDPRENLGMSLRPTIPKANSFVIALVMILPI